MPGACLIRGTRQSSYNTGQLRYWIAALLPVARNDEAMQFIKALYILPLNAPLTAHALLLFMEIFIWGWDSIFAWQCIFSRAAARP